MPVKKFPKQPIDLQDYDIFFDDYVDPLADSVDSVVSVTVDDGITLVSYSLIGDMVKVWIEGGTTDTTYYGEVTVLTVGGRRRQQDFAIKVKQQGKTTP